MTQAEKAALFQSLHRPGAPLVLYNIWDAGSAKAVADAGAPALATGSWSVAAALGYDDGEHLPLDLLLTMAERICASTDLPVSIDFEGCYAAAPDGVAANVARLLKTGAIGINFEDRIVQGSGLYSIDDQSARIKAARAAGDTHGVPFYINARTDLFLGTTQEGHAGFVQEAIARAHAYAAAGASGLFLPGLTDEALMRQIVQATDLPVNVMNLPNQLPHATLADIGVARISFGPAPYRVAMAELGARYSELGLT